MPDENLDRAIALSKSGKKLEAREIFKTILRANRQNETAWLWFADTFPDTPNRIKALEECLKDNPNSQTAQNWLTKFKVEEANGKQELPDFQSNQNEQVGGIDRKLSESSYLSKKTISNQSPKNKRTFVILASGFGLGVLGIVCALGIWILQKQGLLSIPLTRNPLSSISTQNAPITPTLVITSSARPTTTISLTPRNTNTPYPTNTKIPTQTPTKSLTALTEDDLNAALLTSADITFGGLHQASDWSNIDSLVIDPSVLYISQLSGELPIPKAFALRVFSTGKDKNYGDQIEEGIYVFQDERQAQRFYEGTKHGGFKVMELYGSNGIYSTEAYGIQASYSQGIIIEVTPPPKMTFLIGQSHEMVIKIEYIMSSYLVPDDLVEVFAIAVKHIYDVQN